MKFALDIILLLASIFCPRAFGFEDSAGHGGGLTCPPGNALIGACTSGKNNDCAGASHQIVCSKESWLDASQKGGWQGIRVQNNGARSAWAFCPEQQAIYSRCAGGRDEDCDLPGGAYDHGIRCAPMVAGKTISNVQDFVCGDHGIKKNCPADYVAVASCASGENNDCDWSGCSGLQTYTGLLCKRVEDVAPPPPTDAPLSRLDIKGLWRQTGTSGPEVSFAWTYGTSTTVGEEVTETLAEEISMEITAGVSYTPPPTGGVGASLEVSLGRSASQSIATATSSSLTTEESTQTTIGCADPSGSSTGLWFPFQWYLEKEADENGVGFISATNHFVCTGSSLLPPRCPLNYCADPTCQICVSPFENLSAATAAPASPQPTSAQPINAQPTSAQPINVQPTSAPPIIAAVSACKDFRVAGLLTGSFFLVLLLS